jgi:hypothetical protein
LIQEQHPFAKREVVVDPVPPDFPLLRVADVERRLIGRECQAVRLRESFADHEAERAIRIDPIDTLEVQVGLLTLFTEAGCASAVGSVGRVGEEDGAGRVHDEIIWTVERYTVPAISHG